MKNKWKKTCKKSQININGKWQKKEKVSNE